MSQSCRRFLHEPISSSSLPWVKASSWSFQFVSSQVEFKLRSAFVGMFSSFELLKRQPWGRQGATGWNSGCCHVKISMSSWTVWRCRSWSAWRSLVLMMHLTLQIGAVLNRFKINAAVRASCVQVIEDHCPTRVVRPHGVKGFKPADMGSHEVVAAIYQVGRLWRHWRVHTVG